MKEGTITLEIFEEGGINYVFIAEDNSSGAKYAVDSNEDIADSLKNYLDNQR